MSALRNNLLPRTRSVINCLISFLEKRPKLHKFVLGIAQKHDNLIGYRKYGLFRDDIISENDPVIQEALKRLSDKEAFDRTFRLRRAIQLNLNHDVLPPSEQTKAEEDVPYLWKHVEAICKERDEATAFDNAQPTGVKDFFKSSTRKRFLRHPLHKLLMTEKRGGARHHNRPYHNKSSYHPYRSGPNNNRFPSGPSSTPTNRLVSVHEAIKTDRILSIESFANIERINDVERASQEYSEYVKKHQKAHLRTIFNNHKKEKWIINSNSETDKRPLFDAITWTPEINLKYQESFNMKLEESSSNDGNSTETRLLPFENDSELPESFASLLPEFSQQVITMSNIPPYVDKEALEGHLKELSPQSEIEITSPNADKSFYRLAWLKTSGSNDKISELVPKFESLGSIEGAKIYFGLASSNFRRFKVTKYLQSSEEQLLNLAIKLVKIFEKKGKEDFESLFSNSLDKAVIYLRKVHNFCFWCVSMFSCEQEMLSKCGDLHLTMSFDDNENEVKHDQHRLIEKLSALIDFLKNLNEISKETETNLDEALTETSIKKVEEGKYRCNHCSKAFKGPEFVLKHLTLKHEDIVKQTQDDLVDFSKLLSNAQLWLFPTTMIPRYTSIRNKQASHHSNSRDSHGSSKSSLSKGSRGNSKEYMDWDATSNINTATEISYDL